jgi:hypothetical protein
MCEKKDVDFTTAVISAILTVAAMQNSGNSHSLSSAPQVDVALEKFKELLPKVHDVLSHQEN